MVISVMLLFAKRTDILGISTDSMVGAFCGISGPLTQWYLFTSLEGAHWCSGQYIVSLFGRAVTDMPLSPVNTVLNNFVYRVLYPITCIILNLGIYNSNCTHHCIRVLPQIIKVTTLAPCYSNWFLMMAIT